MTIFPPQRILSKTKGEILSFHWHGGASWTTDLLLNIQGRSPGAFETCFVYKVLCRGKLGLGQTVLSALEKALPCRHVCCDEAAHLLDHWWLGRVADN